MPGRAILPSPLHLNMYFSLCLVKSRGDLKSNKTNQFRLRLVRNGPYCPREKVQPRISDIFKLEDQTLVIVDLKVATEQRERNNRLLLLSIFYDDQI